MLLVLSGSNDVTASDGRRVILALRRGLGTKYGMRYPLQDTVKKLGCVLRVPRVGRAQGE